MMQQTQTLDAGKRKTMADKDYYTIKHPNGKPFKGISGRVLFFEYPVQAHNYIKNNLGDSKEMVIEKWVKKKVEE